MLISEGRVRAALAALTMIAVTGAGPVGAQQNSQPNGQQHGRQQPAFKSAEAAYDQGMGAWRGGFVEQAIPALKFAADGNVFFAQFYLARIYADNGTPYTNHPAAFELYNKIARDYANIDPDDDLRAPFVARAFTTLAGYARHGLAQINVAPDAARAVELLRHASQFFNDQEAQFELAKHHLRGEGTRQDTPTGLHWLSTLATRGHAGAQAYLADVYWRGRYGVPRDQLRAFALISVAVENAPDSERIWIEDIHHLIFCGASSGVRTQAEGVVADWRKRYGGTLSSSQRSGLGMPSPAAAERTCRSGEVVAPVRAPTSTVPAERQQAPPRGMLDVGVSAGALPR
jgi:TPR repeat protein